MANYKVKKPKINEVDELKNVGDENITSLEDLFDIQNKINDLCSILEGQELGVVVIEILDTVDQAQ